MDEIKNKIFCQNKSELIEKSIEKGCIEVIPLGSSLKAAQLHMTH